MATKARPRDTHYIELFQGPQTYDQWFFHVKATNGEIVLASEGYISHGNARRAARRVARSFGGLEIRELPR